MYLLKKLNQIFQSKNDLYHCSYCPFILVRSGTAYSFVKGRQPPYLWYDCETDFNEAIKRKDVYIAFIDTFLKIYINKEPKALNRYPFQFIISELTSL